MVPAAKTVDPVFFPATKKVVAPNKVKKVLFSAGPTSAKCFCFETVQCQTQREILMEYHHT